MNYSDIINSILESTDNYSKFLDNITEEQFSQTPANGGWSYSEVYSHIFQANLGSLVLIERCLHGHKSSTGTPTWAGRLVLFFGRFPPVKLTAPAHIAAMVAKTSIEDARNYIIKFREKLLEVAPQVRKAPPLNAAKHPRLGMLNASQWLRFIEIHTKHHLRQLKRIEKLLAKA